MVKPTGKGRQRVEMKKIQNKVHLGVTLTKRRSGLFKKASDLITLCGIQLAIIMFSPGNHYNRVVSFGHPSVYSIIFRYLNHHADDPQVLVYDEAWAENQKAKANDLRAQISDLDEKVQFEKNRAKQLKGQEVVQNDQTDYVQTLELRDLAKRLDQRLNCEVDRRFVHDYNQSYYNHVNPYSLGGKNVHCPNFGP